MIKNMLSFFFNRNYYQIFILLLGFVLFPSLKVYSQNAVFEPEIQRFKAMIDKDSFKLNQLIHTDLIYSHSNGLVENKTEHIHTILSGHIIYQQIINEEFKIRSYGKWKLTNGVIHVIGIIDKKAFDIKLRYSASYINVKRKWQLINWQSTKM
jgi:hypothetical protein